MTKIGRWVVDCHIHCGKTGRHAPDANPEQGIFAEVLPLDNFDWALFDMDAYGIDMGILLPSFTGTTNEMHAAMVRKHPDRFRSCCMDTTQRIKAARGEVEVDHRGGHQGDRRGAHQQSGCVRRHRRVRAGKHGDHPQAPVVRAAGGGMGCHRRAGHQARRGGAFPRVRTGPDRAWHQDRATPTTSWP